MTDARTLQTENLDLIERNKSLETEVKELRQLIEYYKSIIQNKTQKQFNSTSEKTETMQMSLFNEAESEADLTEDEPSATEIITYKRKKKKGKKEEDFAKLETEVVEHNLELKVCPDCGSEDVSIRTETFKEVTLIPAKIIVTEHKTESCVCKNCKNEIIPEDAPAKLLPKSAVSPSLAAYIATQKYAQAQPLDRIEKAFLMQGVNISKQNMCNWLIKLSVILTFMTDAFLEELRNREVIHGDETTVQVHGEEGRSDTKKSYMWVFTSGKCDLDKGIAIFQYRDNRRQENPMEILGDYSGYLHCDGYCGYNSVNAKLCGCWAHVRRKYADAVKLNNCGSIHHIARKGFDYCNKIFILEREFENLSDEERVKKRIELSKPVIEEFFEWADSILPQVPEKSMIRTALIYSLNQRVKLSRFLEDGRIEISNNRAERAVRPFTIGRKNWLFADSPEGAQASANFYSIVETAKLNGLNPYEYLKFIFEYFRSHGRLAFMKTGQKSTLNFIPKDNFVISDLLPWTDSLPDCVKT